MSGSIQCPHTQFECRVEVNKMQDDTIMVCDITGKCADCGKPIVFRSDLAYGVSWNHPTLSPDAQELRLPCSVEGDVVDDRKRPSFTIEAR